MSNVIKFERPPEPEAPKSKKEMAPATRRVLIWAGVLSAFGLAWVYYSVVGN